MSHGSKGRERRPAPPSALAASRDAAVPHAPALLGNRALGHLAGSGAGLLAAQPSLIHAAGNRAIQRLVDPVQRNEDEGQGGPQQNQQSPALTGAQQPVLAATPTTTVADQQLTGTGGPTPDHSVNVVTNNAFRRGTTLTDGIGVANAGVSVTNAGMATTRLGGLSDHATITEQVADSGLPNLLPGVGLALNLVGTVEGAYRADAARSRAQALSGGASRLRDERLTGGGTPAPRTHAEEIMARGAAEQRDEAERRTNSAIMNGVQALTTGVGIGLGPTTAGASTLFGAGALGAMKGAYSAYHFLRRKATSDNAEAHAEQLLFAAQNGDPAAVDTLKRLNVPTENLGDRAVWQSAVSTLAEAMPRDEPRYEDGGAGRPGEPTVIARPTTTVQYEGIGGGDSDDDAFDPLLSGPQVGRRERVQPRLQAGDGQRDDRSFTVNPLLENPRAAALRRPSLDDHTDDDDHQPGPGDLPADLIPSAASDRSDDQSVNLPVVQRPRGGASATLAAALSNAGGNQPARQQQGVAPIPTPDRSPPSDDLVVEEVTDENTPGHGTYTGGGLTFDATGYM